MWKDGSRCAVALSVDFDAETLWLGSFGVDHIGLVCRGEFGARAGLPRILRLFAELDIKATFFIPGLVIERYPDLVAQIHEQGHEIGHHGYMHENPRRMEFDQEKEVIEKGIAAIQRITGRSPVGYRIPTGLYGQNTLKLLVDYGFLYDSSLMGHDSPYMLKVEGAVRELVELPFHWEMDDFPHFFFNIRPFYVGLSSPSKVYEIWADEFDVCYQEGGYYTLTMHPQVIGHRHRMKMLERLLKHIQEYSGVWFARYGEVATYWQQNVAQERKE